MLEQGLALPGFGWSNPLILSEVCAETSTPRVISSISSNSLTITKSAFANCLSCVL